MPIEPPKIELNGDEVTLDPTELPGKMPEGMP
jgi:hypothetical protein